VIRAALCAALALAPLAPARAGEPTLSRLLKRTFDAYGGLPALQRGNARVEEGKVTSAVQGGQAGRLSRTFERPRRLRVEIVWPGEESEVRVLDGARGWRDGVEVSGTVKWAAMALQAARMDLPRLLAEERLKLVDGGTVKRGRQRLRAVTVPLGDGMTLTVEIDPKSGRILRSSGRVDAGPGTTIDLATTYSDFRRVDGVLVPFREASFAQGQRTGDAVLGRVELLRDAPQGSFRP
jgi:hypothetical protein